METRLHRETSIQTFCMSKVHSNAPIYNIINGDVLNISKCSFHADGSIMLDPCYRRSRHDVHCLFV